MDWLGTPQAHAMLSSLGAGAATGIEDAYLLGKLLGHPQTTRANVEVRHIAPRHLWRRRPAAHMSG